MMRVEVMIEECDGQAKVTLTPMVPKGIKPTPLEVVAWQEMRSRIFSKVVVKGDGD